MSEAHSGGCLCGAVRYQVRGRPAFVAVCHCKFCQKRLASAFAVVAGFPEQAVELLQGTLSEYEHHSDESGRWLRLGFCPRCGSSICHTAQARPGMRMVAAGTFDETDWLSIDRHIWLRSKQSWMTIPAGVPGYPQGAPAAPASPGEPR